MDDGKMMGVRSEKCFAAEYNHNGSTWGLEIWADDWQDAERKLRSIGANGRVIGSDVVRIKLPNWTARLLMRLGLMSNERGAS